MCCLSVNFPVRYVCQKWCVYNHLQLSNTTSQVRENVHLTKYPLKTRLLDEVELNTVTISNVSIDMVGEDRYREITVHSGAGESVVNPGEWPKVGLQPSNGSVKGHRCVGRPWR